MREKERQEVVRVFPPFASKRVVIRVTKASSRVCVKHEDS